MKRIRVPGRFFVPAVLVLLIGMLVVFVGSPPAGAAERSPTVAFNTGDVLAAIGSSQVKHFSPTGTFIETLNDTTGTNFTAGMCFDAAGNLYVTNFDANSVSKFNNSGGLVSANYITAINSHPESCVFDTPGNLYIGTADGNGDILKYNSSGTFVTAYDVATQSRGSDWIDLASDQCTMFYTSEGTIIKRFNVCTNTQLTDFATGLTGAIFALRILPDGGVLVAETSQVQRLNSSGGVVSTYPAPAGSGVLFALNRDPNGTQFWTGGLETGNVYKFDISPVAPPVLTFNAGIATALGGLALFGELVVSQPTPTPTGTVLPTLTPTATATSTPTPSVVTAVVPTLSFPALGLLALALGAAALFLITRR